MDAITKIKEMSGKIIGAGLGIFLFHSVILTILGFVVGHMFDRGRQMVRSNPFLSNQWHHTPTQQVFFDTTFSVMGHIAKVDGRVSSSEIQMAESVMARMHMSAEQKQAAIKAFNRGKQADFDLDARLKELRSVCGNNLILLRIFIELQNQTANIDGISEAKAKVLKTIVDTLGAGTSFNAQFFRQHYGTGGAGPRQPGTRYQQSRDPYRVLGVEPDASDAKVKQAYRRAMSENHPDKLVAQGLPEEMIKLANEKTQEISTAYDQIRAQRGMKR